VRLLAVSKTFPAAQIEEASRSGQILFGENRIQEAVEKIPTVRVPGLVWHFIGHLQSNKARLAVQLFDVIETLDSEKIARRINRQCLEFGRTQTVFVQVNVGEETQKSGIRPDGLQRMVDLVDSLPQLHLEGLMAIPPFDPDPERSRPYFQKMSALLAEVNKGRSRPLEELSMGMSHDYPIAIEEGSTLVRLGTAIFGPRT
jgi:pyridoxal phosphate enzyme (YggS family)